MQQRTGYLQPAIAFRVYDSLRKACTKEQGLSGIGRDLRSAPLWDFRAPVGQSPVRLQE